MLGLKGSLLFENVVAACSLATIAASPNKECLLLGRFFIGYVYGGLNAVTPVYYR